jgi:hypothetical protein
MFPEKIDQTRAYEVRVPRELLESTLRTKTDPNAGLANHDATARIGAALIIGALPFLALWLLVRFIWQDLKAIFRGAGFFYRAVAEDLSRKA